MVKVDPGRDVVGGVVGGAGNVVNMNQDGRFRPKLLSRLLVDELVGSGKGCVERCWLPMMRWAFLFLASLVLSLLLWLWKCLVPWLVMKMDGGRP